jgi:hypothetical protein
MRLSLVLECVKEACPSTLKLQDSAYCVVKQNLPHLDTPVSDKNRNIELRARFVAFHSFMNHFRSTAMIVMV